MAIPNFSDTTFFQASLRIAVDAPLLFLSRVERIKGAHTAIEIAQQAGRILIIAGNKVESGEGALYWANKIAPHIDGRQIKYVGPVNNEQKRDLLSEAAALVVPVQWGEPFGIVFVEALACGTPVISCPRGALPEIIEHSRHGFLVNSVAEGVEAVRHVGTISRQVCRARAEERFSQHVVASQYESLYERILSRK
jgi:glycosyltransferase involved in cell wall biosynthesis